MDVAKFLKPGDVLLYKPKGVYGWFIRLKTWHPIAHVEAYVGGGMSVASRDGKGVAFYPTRWEGLVMVCRPTQHFSLADALKWARTQVGTPYGWEDLLQFIGINRDAKGIVCSPFITLFSRAGGIDPFNGEPAEKIAPFQFETSNVYQKFTVTNGKVLE